MPSPLWLPSFGLLLLASASCSSTLDEYRCTENQECMSQEGNGLCHSSGYCAFLDVEGCDGYRFGKHSGEASRECVGAVGEPDARVGGDIDADIADAGNVEADADISLPIAIISGTTPGCDLTSLVVDGQGSTAGAGASLTYFEWTLRDPSGQNLMILGGGPGNNFLPNDYFLFGTVDNAMINITPYRDQKAMHVDTASDYASVYQTGLGLSAGPGRLTFAAASATASNLGELLTVTARVSGLIVHQEDFALTQTMTNFGYDYDAASPTGTLSIGFSRSKGVHYIDDVRLFRASNDASGFATIVNDGSFEMGTGAWSTNLDDPDATATIEILPESLRQLGVYEIQLVVTDSNGVDSAAAVKEITHSVCN